VKHKWGKWTYTDLEIEAQITTAIKRGRKGPKLLDLFCGAGGAAMGYHQAGFDNILGVDINPQPRYPFKFVQADAIEFAIANIYDFDYVHASPPCQHYTRMLNHGLTDRGNHPDLIRLVRNIVKIRPYVIENVVGAPLLVPTVLCGEMFGLRVTRHRLFESNMFIAQPRHIPHRKEGGIRKQNDGGYYYRVYGHETGKASWGKAMGIDWMKSWELAQAIPPAFTKYIGKEILHGSRN